MTDETETPLIVNASPVADQAATLARDMGLILSALPMLIALIGKHDAVGLIAYFGSSDFAPVMGLVVTGGIVGWRQINARLKKRNLVTVAAAAPNSVAIVK